jgi:hypothetical protein
MGQNNLGVPATAMGIGIAIGIAIGVARDKTTLGS